MKIVFTSKGTGPEAPIDPRFGRTEFFTFYDEETGEYSSLDNRDEEEAAHGAGPLTAQKLHDHSPQVLITGNGPGGNAAAVLEKMKIIVFAGAGQMTVKEAYEAYKQGRLTEL